MDTKTLRLFSKYNEEVNRKMGSIIDTLTREQWGHKFGGYFNSIYRLCNHIYICDFNWLKRFFHITGIQFYKKGSVQRRYPVYQVSR